MLQQIQISTMLQTKLNNSQLSNMAAKSLPVRFGVLNVTICFQQPHQQRSKRIEQNRAKVHAVPLFVPRYSLPRQNKSISAQKRLSTRYQHQRHSHHSHHSYDSHHSPKESLRYFREKQKSTNRQKYIQRLVAKNEGAGQLQFNEDLAQKEQKLVASSKQSNDGHLRLFYVKRHLRNAADCQKQCTIQTFPTFPHGNPEENLRSIFTVRTIKTSMRNVRRRKEVAQQKPTLKVPRTRQQVRSRVDQLEKSTVGQIKIRPWSPIRQSFIKKAMFQSAILASFQPPQSNTQ